MVVAKLRFEDGVVNGGSGVAEVAVVKETTAVRRTSSRVQKLMAEKKTRRESLEDVDDELYSTPKRKRPNQRRKAGNSGERSVAKRSLKEAEHVEKASSREAESVDVGSHEDMTLEKAGEEAECGVKTERSLVQSKDAMRRSELINDLPHMREYNFGTGNDKVQTGSEKSDHARAKDTLRLFNKHYLQLIQEEEKRCGVSDPKSKKSNKSNNSKKEENGNECDGKGKAKRPDLKAITKMMKTNTILFPEKRIGPIPGIDVGYQFFSRAEMVVIGLHSHWLNGIDYMGQNCSKRYPEYTMPLATAIVISGQYEDDLDNSEDVVYTGQGGNNLLGDKRQIKDQELKRGNLALKHSCEQGLPVRVVRGHDNKNSYVGRVYTYDGLYKVIKYWPETGISGFIVYKYRLSRIEGQPTLTTSQVHFARGGVPKQLTDIRGLVCEDISGGQERIPIPATNLVDDPPVAPSGFAYHKSMKLSKSVKMPSIATGCKCKGDCTDSRVCSCAQLNGSDFPYVLRVNNRLSCYRLVEAKDVVFECGPGCGCGPDCVNRASQRGMEYRLEVFRTPNKGWAVRAWDYIPAGAPVCEYIGVMKTTDEPDYDHDNSYIFDIDCLQTMEGLDGREKRYRNVSNIVLDKGEDQRSDIPEFCIDAGASGNVARFINHSCEPNLFVQCVLSSHHDLRLARIILFAADTIPPLQELTYDYGYALNSVVGPDEVPKQLNCYCGAVGCKKRLY